jgi:hypothetical protein
MSVPTAIPGRKRPPRSRLLAAKSGCLVVRLSDWAPSGPFTYPHFGCSLFLCASCRIAQSSFVLGSERQETYLTEQADKAAVRGIVESIDKALHDRDAKAVVAGFAADALSSRNIYSLRPS